MAHPISNILAFVLLDQNKQLPFGNWSVIHFLVYFIVHCLLLWSFLFQCFRTLIVTTPVVSILTLRKTALFTKRPNIFLIHLWIKCYKYWYIYLTKWLLICSWNRWTVFRITSNVKQRNWEICQSTETTYWAVWCINRFTRVIQVPLRKKTRSLICTKQWTRLSRHLVNARGIDLWIKTTRLHK